MSKIQATEEQVILQKVDPVATRILTDFARFATQPRGLTQAVPYWIVTALIGHARAH